MLNADADADAIMQITFEKEKNGNFFRLEWKWLNYTPSLFLFITTEWIKQKRYNQMTRNTPNNKIDTNKRTI